MPQVIENSADFIKPRVLNDILQVLSNSGIVILPSDSGYVLLSQLGNKNAATRIRQIRQLDKNHLFTLICSDLTHLAHYARADNVQFRLLKKIFPGSFTCILPAGKDVPRLVQHDKRKTIGIRIPDQKILNSIISAHGEALMGVSLFSDMEDNCLLEDLDLNIRNAVDLILDCGYLPVKPTTVVDLTIMPPEIIRQGYGNLSDILGN